MPWGNATLRDALKVVSDMEASGAHPDLRTRELLLDMANLTEARAKNCETKSCETTFESGDARESCGADESGGPRESGGPLESGPARESHFRESGAGTADLVRSEPLSPHSRPSTLRPRP
ncbi:hypothetical protein T484DRAFT_2629155 [Baffinella frigidus]|nr:hypothetical protein T484DRAFT_2629155 [Cryptophyta sp. CCMP2293]